MASFITPQQAKERGRLQALLEAEEKKGLELEAKVESFRAELQRVNSICDNGAALPSWSSAWPRRTRRSGRQSSEEGQDVAPAGWDLTFCCKSSGLAHTLRSLVRCGVGLFHRDFQHRRICHAL